MLGLDIFQFYRTFELGLYRVAVFRIDNQKPDSSAKELDDDTMME